MSKYDWTNVPDDVEWIATDKSGIRCEYRSEPNLGVRSWQVKDEDDIGGCYFDSTYQDNWMDSLEERPK